jgi:hypothetical protein
MERLAETDEHNDFGGSHEKTPLMLNWGKKGNKRNVMFVLFIYNVMPCEQIMLCTCK